MARKFLVGIDLNKSELQNARIQNLGTAPSSPVAGQLYYDTATSTLEYWNGAAWVSANGSDIPDSTITSAKIADGAIMNVDINASAAIALSKLATDPLARANHTGTQLAATISNFDTQVRTSRLDQMAVPTASVSMNSQKITGLLDGTAATDAVNKGQLDAARSSLDLKDSVRVASSTNVNTASPGASIDSVGMSAGDRVLLRGQTAPAENGIWVWNGAAVAMTRATDADSSAEVTSGMFTFVEAGTDADSGWVLTTDGAITVGTTALAFTQFSGAGSITAGAGLTKTGSTLDVVGTTNRIVVNADNIDISASYVGQTSITTLGTITTGTWNGTAIGTGFGGTGATTVAGAKTNLGFMTRYSANFGDGAALTYNIDHNLGTLDVTVQVFQNSNGVEVECDVTRSTTNRVIIGTDVAPASNALRVVITG